MADDAQTPVDGEGPTVGRVLHEDPVCRIELFTAPDVRRSRQVAVTFTAAANRSLEGNAGPGPMLGRMGFDVISIKRVVDDWYQGVDPRVLDAVARRVTRRRYRRRVAVGDSAGASAAIMFSRHLRLDTVVAFAPQYSFEQGYDRRWATITDALTWRYRITAESIAPDCDFVVAYDPGDPIDSEHLARLATVIPAGRLHPWEVPGAEHAVTPRLYSLGVLKEVTAYAVEHRTLTGFRLPDPAAD